MRNDILVYSLILVIIGLSLSIEVLSKRNKMKSVSELFKISDTVGFFTEFGNDLIKIDIDDLSSKVKEIKIIGKKKKRRKHKKKKKKIELNGPLKINKAVVSDFQKLPGIGKVVAQRIVDFRSKIGKIEKLSQLVKVKGISLNKLIKVQKWLTIEGGVYEKLEPKKTKVRKLKVNLKEPININTASVEEFTKLPGIGKKMSNRIIDRRKEVKKFEDIFDLTQIKGISENKIKKLSKWLTTESINKPGKLKNEEKVKEIEKVEETKKIDEDITKTKVKSKNIVNAVAGKIDINSASLDELVSLPRIGPSTAKNIIEYRKKNQFKKIEDIINVKRI